MCWTSDFQNIMKPPAPLTYSGEDSRISALVSGTFVDSLLICDSFLFSLIVHRDKLHIVLTEQYVPRWRDSGACFPVESVRAIGVHAERQLRYSLLATSYIPLSSQGISTLVSCTF